MKIYSFLFLFLLSSAAFAQKELTAKRTQYYNSGLAASLKTYDAFFDSKKQINQHVYKIYENQYARQQQRIAVLAREWASGKDNGKDINAALALVAKADVGAAVKLMESKLKTRQTSDEAAVFLAALYEFSGQHEQAEKSLEGHDAGLQEGLYHSFLLASVGKTDQARALTDGLYGFFSEDTAALVRIKLQNSFIDTLSKNYAGAAAALIEAQYLLDKIKPDSVQQYWSTVVLAQLAQLQNRSGNIDNAYRNAQSSVAVAGKTGNLPLQALVYHIMGQVYKKAGANQQADTHFQASLQAYTKLAADYPQQYQPLLADVMNDYVEVLRWFDRKEESMAMLRKIAALRKQLAAGNYPFFTLYYARSLGRIADQYVFAYSRIDSAESVSKVQKEVLSALYAQYPLLAGADYSTVLANLGDIQMTLKRHAEGTSNLKQALEVRDRLYKAFPDENKYELMNLLVRNGTANGLYGGDIALAYLQLDRADALARELKELRLIGEIERLKQHIQKKK